MATNTIDLPYLFEPRSYQWRIWDAWDAGKRRFGAVWHRRSGKDKSFLNFTIERMLERKGNYFHVFPKLNQGRRVIWTGIDKQGRRYLDHFPPQLLYSPPNNADMQLTLVDPADRSKPGSTYQVLGTDRNLDVLVGGNGAGYIFSEYALQNPQGWELARPILRENGGWAAFLTTPRGKNHAYTLFRTNYDNPDWHFELLNVDNTWRDATGEDGGPVITDADIESDRREGMSDDLIDQEYYLSWEAAIPGAYFANEFRLVDQERRITMCRYDPSYPVYTSWDIGVDDMTAIWCCQFVGRDINLIHYYENSGFAAKHYADYLTALNFTFKAHLLPHDGRNREWGSAGMSGRAERREEVVRRLLSGEVHSVQSARVDIGIEQMRTMFPRLIFDSVRCEAGIERLRHYHHEWDSDNRVFLPRPEHDWSCHAADALRTLAGNLGLIDAIEKRSQGRPVRGERVRRTIEVAPGQAWMV